MSYQLVCGIETHIELATQSKIFCGCSTAFGGAPNTRCCPVCTGQPGALPVLNKRVVEYAVRAGIATHCKINLTTRFDRKNYFYPDLPKAYQISQYDAPVCTGGYVTLDSGKKIGITRIHMEEDAGKLIHANDKTLIDYNRAGVPLLEIVSQPDISSPEEAKEYVEKLLLIMRYIGVSQCKMQEGNVRCDVNVSVKKAEDTALGTRTEIKNMNSLSLMTQAMDYEFHRQCKLLDEGKKIEQATLRFDEKAGKTLVMRAKEQLNDYRYFPEPDIYPLQIPQEEVEKIKLSLPELPDNRLLRYTQTLGISLHNAKLLYSYRRVCDFVERALALGAGVKNTVNFMLGAIFATLATEQQKEEFALKITAEQFAELIVLVDEGKINVTAGQITLDKMLKTGKSVTAFLSQEDLQGLSEEGLLAVCKQAIEQNPKIVADFLSGKDKAIFGLFGFIKQATQGRADMRQAERLLRNLLK